MKDKFIRILSPMTLAVVILLDLAVIGYGVFAVYRLTQVRTGMTVIFAIIEIAAIVIAVLTTKETVKNGLLLRATDFEFTGMDKDNVYAYDQIKDITGYKDEAPSLVKNFIDRHAVLTLTLTDDTTVLLDSLLGDLKGIGNRFIHHALADKNYHVFFTICQRIKALSVISKLFCLEFQITRNCQSFFDCFNQFFFGRGFQKEIKCTVFESFDCHVDVAMTG